jgi:hypothetical protein
MFTSIYRLREAFNQTSEGKYRLSVNDFIIKASALALKAVPEVNSAWQGESIRRYVPLLANSLCSISRLLIIRLNNPMYYM